MKWLINMVNYYILRPGYISYIFFYHLSEIIEFCLDSFTQYGGCIILYCSQLYNGYLVTTVACVVSSFDCKQHHSAHLCHPSNSTLVDRNNLHTPEIYNSM